MAAPGEECTLADRDPSRQPIDRFFPRGLQSRPRTANARSIRRARVHTRYVRLTDPLVRERGKLRRATWDEALERVAGQLRKTLDASGPDSVGIFSCSPATYEVNVVAEMPARVVSGTDDAA